LIQILGEDLARVISNTMKFVNPKSIYLPGELLFDLTNEALSCYACDDYIAIKDSAPIKGEGDAVFVLSLDDAKDLEKFARENKKTDLGIYITIDIVKVEVNDVDDRIYELAEYREANWDIVDLILFEELPRIPFDDLAFRPERFTKFSQLKHDNEAPMHWRLHEINGNAIVRFTIGDTICGAIRPVNLGVK
jgi:hypothetical protein